MKMSLQLESSEFILENSSSMKLRLYNKRLCPHAPKLVLSDGVIDSKLIAQVYIMPLGEAMRLKIMLLPLLQLLIS